MNIEDRTNETRHGFLPMCEQIREYRTSDGVIRYILADPSGNVTLLVLDPVPVEKQPETAAELMKKEPLAEQAGFLSFPDSFPDISLQTDPAAPASAENASGGSTSGSAGYDIELRMAGGEFCGNAAMSAGAFYCLQNGLTRGRVAVKVSGAPAPVMADIQLLTPAPVTTDIQLQPSAPDRTDEAADGSVNDTLDRAVSETLSVWQGTVEMPLPRAIENICFPDGQTLPVVSFEGISHVIIERKEVSFLRGDHSMSEENISPETDITPEENLSPKTDIPPEVAETLVREWCRYLNVDALGLMFLDRDAGTLTPLVYVPAADTLFWENSCGSGTAAVGAWLASQADGSDTFGGQDPVTVVLKQPGGILESIASAGGPLLLKGTIKLPGQRRLPE